MFKLESNRIKREFKITNGSFYASQILNKYSGLSFVPDGNGSEFVIRFTDGSTFSAKGLPVVESKDEDDRLSFTFKECMGVTVKLEYWVHDDGNTICKQLTLTQSDDKEIDFIFLEYVGIINSKAHLGCEVVEDSQIPQEWAMLGQPYYIDSLFFGCEFPGADCRIVHGMGRVKYYLGKNVGANYKCPITVMGAAKDITINETKKAFFEYLDSISVGTSLRFNYNNWFETIGKMNAETVKEDFGKITESAKAHGIALDSCVIDDGWCDYKGDFWSVSKKRFPGGIGEIRELCEDDETKLGLWLSPRGGYSKQKKFAKRIQKAGNGFYNDLSEDICVASTKYINKLGEYLIQTVNEEKLDFLKLDGFWHKPCRNTSHDHMTGGRDDMYLASDMIMKWVKLFEKLRKSGGYAEKLFISMTSYVNPSPFWLQWVNSIWLQNSDDIGFAQIAEGESKLDEEITYRDARYYDLLCTRSAQLPAYAIFNHEPIYAKGADVEYSDMEFEKYLYWNAVRGQALNELYISDDMMSDTKWGILSDVIKFQRENFEILKYASFIGGNPEGNNVYGYISWNEGGGIIALRNPDGERSPLTLTLNKLMGTPESLSGARLEKIFCNDTLKESEGYSYGDKVSLELEPFETVILKFTNEEKHYEMY